MLLCLKMVVVADVRLAFANGRIFRMGEETQPVHRVVVLTVADHRVDLVTDRAVIERREMATSHHRFASAQRGVRAQKRESVSIGLQI